MIGQAILSTPKLVFEPGNLPANFRPLSINVGKEAVHGNPLRSCGLAVFDVSPVQRSGPYGAAFSNAAFIFASKSLSSAAISRAF